MAKNIIKSEFLFEVIDIFGRKIHTTAEYWKNIKILKHRELKYGIDEVKKTLATPDEVRRSITDTTILLFAKKVQKHDILIVAVKVLNGTGFLVTCYQTKKYKEKGELLWPTQKRN